MRQIPITFHVPMGKVTWATPNGRPASEYLSEGISASHGMDVKGPTVALSSMARGRNLSYREKEGDLINLKFSPANVAGEEGTRRLMQIIRTWCGLKHWHVQFNILNKRDAAGGAEGPGKVPEPDRAHRRLLRVLRRSLADAAGGDHRADGRADGLSQEETLHDEANDRVIRIVQEYSAPDELTPESNIRAAFPAQEAALNRKGEAYYETEDRVDRYCPVERKGESRSDGVQPSIWMGVQPRRQRGRQDPDGRLAITLANP